MPANKTFLRNFAWAALMLPLCLLSSEILRGQDAPAGGDSENTEATAPDLSVKQAQLADRFKRLEQVIGRLAELSAGSDPRRAELLRQAIAQSREQDINVRFEGIVKLLEGERLSAAATNQTDLQQELESLLNLLLKADRDATLASERERVRAYLKELNRLMRLERDLRARTENGDDVERLTESQQRVANETGKLGDQIAENERDESLDEEKSGEAKSESAKSSDGKSGAGKSEEGKSGDSESKAAGKDSEKSSGKSNDQEKQRPQPGKNGDKGGSPGQEDGKKGEPSGQPPQGGEEKSGDSKSGDSESQPPSQRPTDRATEQLRKARQQMEEAIKKLEETSREGATEQQQQAIESLEVAKAELERVLRQLREEEMERTLTQLAARFRRMLELQTEVYEGTVRLDRIAADDRDQGDEIEAARLSRQESSLEREADKALLLLREEGSSVAFPETVELLRDDMGHVTQLLSKVDVGVITQGLETDIIAALEETIAALDKALKDLESNRTPQGGSPSGSEQAEPPLVDAIAELKMIRSLQMRINIRTERYGKLITGEHADQPDILSALEDLAKRQERVVEATEDLSQRRNE